MWFKKNKQLKDELLYYRVQLQLLRTAIYASNSVEELRSNLDLGKNINLEQSGWIAVSQDVLLGKWFAKLLAKSFSNFFQDVKAVNYIEVTVPVVTLINEFNKEEQTEEFIVTIRKKNGETPADQIKKLKEKLFKLQVKKLND